MMLNRFPGRAPRRYMLSFSASLLVLMAACTPASQSPASDTPSNTTPQSTVIGETDTGASYLVHDQAAYQEALSKLEAGDTIVLANGRWENFEILFTGIGTQDAPITLKAETPGQVIVSGQSNLSLSGEHLLVSGLWFKDGYSPTSEVISFRSGRDTLANHSRVTQTVIDNFNKPERFGVDFWVMVYGKDNRFDHNSLVGKRNVGVTMAVRMNTEASRENNHRIDHNYYGPREILGSNGGETLRIGTSHYSLSDSFTVVENNYFDRADGELEIISSKSGGNVIRNNTFFESRGTLTMRHGNNTTVEGNVFFGNGADHTGGIRVINGGQVVRNNYMEGLKGSRFGGALVVMNGVPDSPINRYHQVEDAVIENNALINSDNIQLAAGSDQERSAVPVDSTFKNNLIFNEDGRDTFTIYDNVSGIEFADNVISEGVNSQIANGFEGKALSMSRAANGLLYADGLDAGPSRDLKVTGKDDVGPSWYTKPGAKTEFGSGSAIAVPPGKNTLFEAVLGASDGDTFALSAGEYTESKTIIVDKTLSLEGAGATMFFERPYLFQINEGGSLRIDNVNISGAEAPDYAGNAVIRTSPYAMLRNYRLEILNANFTDLDVNHSFNIISTAKGTFANDIVIKNTTFEDVSGSILKLDKETDDYGIYNAEYLTIEDSTFENIGQELVKYYRGGTDESTFGPHFTLTNSSLINVGNDRRNRSKAVFNLHGVQVTDISGNTIRNSPKILINHTVGEPKTRIIGNDFEGLAGIEVNELNSAFENTAVIKDNEM